jgi:hypothetical protein
MTQDEKIELLLRYIVLKETSAYPLGDNQEELDTLVQTVVNEIGE